MGEMKSRNHGTCLPTKAERPSFKGSEPKLEERIPPKLLQSLKGQLGQFDGMEASEVEARMRQKVPQVAKLLDERGIMEDVALLLLGHAPGRESHPNSIRTHNDADPEGATMEAGNADRSSGRPPTPRQFLRMYSELQQSLKGCSHEEKIARASQLAKSIQEHFVSAGADVEFKVKQASTKKESNERLDDADHLAMALHELESFSLKMRLKALGHKERDQWIRLLVEARELPEGRWEESHGLVSALERLERRVARGGESELSKEASSLSLSVAEASAQVDPGHETPKGIRKLLLYATPSAQNGLTACASVLSYGLLKLSSDGFSHTASWLNQTFGSRITAHDVDAGAIVALIALPLTLELMDHGSYIRNRIAISIARTRVLRSFEALAREHEGYTEQLDALSGLLKGPKSRKLMMDLDCFRDDSSLAGIARAAGLADETRNKIYAIVDTFEAELIADALSPLWKLTDEARYKGIRGLMKDDALLGSKLEELFAKDRQGAYAYPQIRDRALVELAKRIERASGYAQSEGEARKSAESMLAHLEVDYRRYREEED